MYRYFTEQNWKNLCILSNSPYNKTKFDTLDYYISKLEKKCGMKPGEVFEFNGSEYYIELVDPRKIRGVLVKYKIWANRCYFYLAFTKSGEVYSYVVDSRTHGIYAVKIADANMLASKLCNSSVFGKTVEADIDTGEVAVESNNLLSRLSSGVAKLQLGSYKVWHDKIGSVKSFIYGTGLEVEEYLQNVGRTSVLEKVNAGLM